MKKTMTSIAGILKVPFCMTFVPLGSGCEAFSKKAYAGLLSVYCLFIKVQAERWFCQRGCKKITAPCPDRVGQRFYNKCNSP